MSVTFTAQGFYPDGSARALAWLELSDGDIPGRDHFIALSEQVRDASADEAEYYLFQGYTDDADIAKWTKTSTPRGARLASLRIITRAARALKSV
jgi:hypothetical protein